MFQLPLVKPANEKKKNSTTTVLSAVPNGARKTVSEHEETLPTGSRANRIVTRSVCNVAADIADGTCGRLTAAAAALRLELNDVKVQLVAARLRNDDLRAQIAAFDGCEAGF